MNVQNESCHEKTTLMSLPTERAKQLLYYAQWVGHFLCKRDFYINRQNLDSHLLLYTAGGSGIIKYKHTSYRLKRGDVLLLNCLEPHEYYPDGDGWEFRYIHFNGAESASLCSFITSSRGTVIENCEGLEHLFCAVYDGVESSARESSISSAIYEILMRLTDVEERYDPLKSAISYIAKEYSRGIGVGDVARALHLSRSYFSMEFKRRAGISPGKYIDNYRLEAAKNLLLTTSDSIYEIASACGYADSASFIRAFSRVTGKSPNKYRKSEE